MAMHENTQDTTPEGGITIPRPASLSPYIWDHVTPLGDRHGLIRVGPVLAQHLLLVTGGNRRVIAAEVSRYTEMMREGRFLDNTGGDFLFDPAGRFRGGQHRTRAVISSGETVSFKVRWDQTEQEIAADNEGGTPWKAADISGGGEHAVLRQAITYFLLVIDRHGGDFVTHRNWMPDRIRVSELMTDPRVRKAAVIASHVRSGTRGAIVPSAAGAVYATLVQAGHGDPDDFFERLASGACGDKGSPLLTLREMLMDRQVFRNDRRPADQTAYVMVRAWNAHLEGRQLHRILRFTTASASTGTGVKPSSPARVRGWTPFFPQALKGTFPQALKDAGII